MVMRTGVYVVAVAVLGAGMVACRGELAGGVRKGEGISVVQADYGKPDVISDESGDQERFYLPGNRPGYEWPAEAPRTFYYLRRDLAVKFVSGKAIWAGAIEQELKERVLVPMAARKEEGK